jgi:hypothetical protein
LLQAREKVGMDEKLWDEKRFRQNKKGPMVFSEECDSLYPVVMVTEQRLSSL